MEKREITKITMGLMVVVALFYDIVQIGLSTLPLAGWIISPLVSVFAFLTFYVWFKTYGRNFMTPKRALAMGGGAIIEMIPILNILPAWTMAVLFLIGLEKAEKLASVVPGGKTLGNVAKGRVVGSIGQTASTATKERFNKAA